MIPFPINLEGKVVVVTGGSGVLCSEMARALGKCGAKVAILGRTLENVEHVATEINDAGGTALGVAGDVTDVTAVRNAEATVSERFGPCDILINGAGGNHPKGTTSLESLTPATLETADADVTTFYDLEPAGLEFVLSVNFIGTIIPTQVFTRKMAERGHGTVVNISSMSAYQPLTKVMAYSAAKSAINNVTQWLAVHLSKVGIRVNAIAPGFFLTTQNKDLLTNPDGSMTARGGRIIDHTPMGRYGVPFDLVGTLLWLCCDEASGFVTGIVIPVDGGFMAFAGV